ncbi:hypothetical protein PSA5_20735 [Pseudomonas syringae pv. actinidiae]|nr:hypothetical protein PSA5_20735 [Pseudomonas syringae pv. actinidiae]
MHAQRLWPGCRAAQAQFETELYVFARFFTAACESMNDAAALGPVALEGGNHIGMTAAHMQQGRQIEVGRQLQLRLEDFLLAHLVQMIDVVIQANLAHCAQLRMAFEAGQPVAQFGQVLCLVLIDINRVQAERCMQLRVGFGQVP